MFMEFLGSPETQPRKGLPDKIQDTQVHWTSDKPQTSFYYKYVPNITWDIFKY